MSSRTLSQSKSDAMAGLALRAFSNSFFSLAVKISSINQPVCVVYTPISSASFMRRCSASSSSSKDLWSSLSTLFLAAVASLSLLSNSSDLIPRHFTNSLMPCFTSFSRLQLQPATPTQVSSVLRSLLPTPAFPCQKSHAFESHRARENSVASQHRESKLASTDSE